MKTIKELCGYAWEMAIRNTISKLNIAGAKYGIVFNFGDDSALVEGLAMKLGIKYDENGFIV